MNSFARIVPPLERDELEHYRWLLTGLLDGGFRLAAEECAATSAVPAALDESRSLVDELFARLIPVDDEMVA